MEVTTVGVAGLGLMGAGIARLAAQAGFETIVYDVETGRAGEFAQTAEPGWNVQATDRLQDFEGCDLILEAIVEALEPKLAFFRSIEEIAPHAVLVSNSSTYMPGEIAPALTNPDRLINCHFFNPAEVVPLVEIVSGGQTDPELVPIVSEFVRALGKTPIVLKKEIPGFIANRLQAAILRECYSLVDDGIASATDIDRVVQLSLAPRWSALGPLATADLGGLDVFAALTARLFPVLDRGTETPLLMRQLIDAGKQGAKSGNGLYTWTPAQRSEALERVNRFFQLACSTSAYRAKESTEAVS